MKPNGEAVDLPVCPYCMTPILPGLDGDPATSAVKAHRLCVEQRMVNWR